MPVKVIAGLGMPTGYHINHDDGIISVRVNEQIDLVDLYQIAKSLRNDNDYDTALPLLVDLRGMRLDLVREALEPFNEYVITSFGSGRQAATSIVIDADMDERLCAAVYWLACAVDRTEMFDDYDHAMKWLIRQSFVAPPRTVPASPCPNRTAGP